MLPECKVGDRGHVDLTNRMVHRFNQIIYTLDFTSIQAAIDYASTQGGGIVVLNPGNNITQNRLVVRDNVSLVGHPNTVLTWQSGYSGNSLLLIGAKNISVDSIDFDCNHIGNFGIEIIGGENIFINKTICRNSNNDGVYLLSGKQVTFENVTSRENLRSGFVIISASNIIFDKCRSINVVLTHYDIEPNNLNDVVQNITYANCEATDENPEYGAVAFQATFGNGVGANIRILNNNVNVGETFGQFALCNNLFIENNIAKVHSLPNANELVRFTNISNSRFVGNFIEDVGAGVFKPMLIKECSNSDFLYNTFKTRNLDGILAQSNIGCNIDFNRILST